MPQLQRQGTGAALIRRGLDECGAAGARFVVLVGEPAYYGRFGFEPGHRWGVRTEFEVPEAYVLALELIDGGLARGVIRYHPAFSMT